MAIPSTGTTSRRGLLRAALGSSPAADAGAAAAPRTARRVVPESRRRAVQPGQRLHLLRRATFGITPGLVEEVDAVGGTRWLESQLDPASIDDAACDAYLARWPALTWNIPDARRNQVVFGWDAMFQLGQATIARQIWSRRQLFEILVDLWSNHLNVTCPSGDVWDSRPDYDLSVIRRHALGSFRELLVASANHPAMLRYLDNASSTKAAPNENYARELLELHTVGVDAGYTEADVQAAARLLTGLTVDDSTGLRRYAGWQHHTGAGTVMGFEVPEHSRAEGQGLQTAFLGWLASHPATARHLATKLAVRFVSDTPPASLVDRLAAAYLSADTAIVPVLRVLFDSPEFRASAGQKVRRPLEQMVATLRVLGVQPDASGRGGTQELYWIVQKLGQAPLAWAPPNGYPDVAGAWQSAASTLGRWNTTLELVAGWWPPGLRYPPVHALLPAALPATYGGVLDALGERLIQRPLRGAERTAALTFVGRTESSPARAGDEFLSWHLPHLVALVLDGPGHALR